MRPGPNRRGALALPGARRGTTLVLVTRDACLAARCQGVLKMRSSVIVAERAQPDASTAARAGVPT